MAGDLTLSIDLQSRLGAMSEELHVARFFERVLNTWWLSLVAGSGLVGLGLFTIVALGIATTGFALLVGVVLLVASVLEGMAAMNGGKPAAQRALDAGIATACLVAGVYLLTHAYIGPVIVALVVAVLLPVLGAAKVLTALKMRHLPRWGWILSSGVVSIGLGVLIWVYGPRSMAHLSGVLLGIDMVITGMVIISVAGSLRGSHTLSEGPLAAGG